jgi:hypothetical protein
VRKAGDRIAGDRIPAKAKTSLNGKAKLAYSLSLQVPKVILSKKSGRQNSRRQNTGESQN